MQMLVLAKKKKYGGGFYDGNGYLWRLDDPSNNSFIGVGVDNSSYYISGPAVNIPDYIWIHQAFTYGNGKMTAVANGTNIHEGSRDTRPIFNVPETHLYIGKDPTLGYGSPEMILDELMIFNRPLDANEINWLYKYGLPHNT